jgi:hypothetical protein
MEQSPPKEANSRSDVQEISCPLWNRKCLCLHESGTELILMQMI